MSSFKKLSKADVTSVSYAANKQWVLPFDCPSINNEYFNVYKGTFITGTFISNDYSIDPITNEQYERLVYDFINHVFYQSYNGSLNTGSLMFNILTYESASQQRPTGSYFNYNTNPLLVKNFPTGIGEGIRVLSLNQNIYGSKILPCSFELSSSAYRVVDDGYGNLYADSSCLLYEFVEGEYSYTSCSGEIVTGEFIYSPTTRSIAGGTTITSASGYVTYIGSGPSNHIGNIFYSHGLAVITNQDYQLMFPLPPIANNDIATFLTSDTGSKIINVLQNDVSRSCLLDTSSIVLSGSNTNYYTVNGDGTITLNVSSSGNYDVYYTVNNICGTCSTLTSNKAKISTNVIQVLPPPCIAVSFNGVRGGSTFYYIPCGGSEIESIHLEDYDNSVQRCIEGSFGISGSNSYTFINECTGSIIPTGSYTVNIYGSWGEYVSVDPNSTIWYSIDTGSFSIFSPIVSEVCSYLGSLSMTSGSTLNLYIDNGLGSYYYFNANTSSVCPSNSNNYCGIYSIGIGSSMDISLKLFTSGSPATAVVCTPP